MTASGSEPPTLRVEQIPSVWAARGSHSRGRAAPGIGTRNVPHASRRSGQRIRKLVGTEQAAHLYPPGESQPTRVAGGPFRRRRRGRSERTRKRGSRPPAESGARRRQLTDAELVPSSRAGQFSFTGPPGIGGRENLAARVAGPVTRKQEAGKGRHLTVDNTVPFLSRLPEAHDGFEIDTGRPAANQRGNPSGRPDRLAWARGVAISNIHGNPCGRTASGADLQATRTLRPPPAAAFLGRTRQRGR